MKHWAPDLAERCRCWERWVRLGQVPPGADQPIRRREGDARPRRLPRRPGK